MVRNYWVFQFCEKTDHLFLVVTLQKPKHQHCKGPQCDWIPLHISGLCQHRTALLTPTQLLISPQHWPAGSTACSKANFSPAHQSHAFVSRKWKSTAYLKHMHKKVLESICLTWVFWQLWRAAFFHPVSAVHCTLNFKRARGSPTLPPPASWTVNPLPGSPPECTRVLGVSSAGASHLTCPRNCWERAGGSWYFCPVWIDSLSFWWILSGAYWRSPKMRSCRSETGEIDAPNESLNASSLSPNTEIWCQLQDRLDWDSSEQEERQGWIASDSSRRWELPIAIISTTHITGALQWIPTIIQETQIPQLLLNNEQSSISVFVPTSPLHAMFLIHGELKSTNVSHYELLLSSQLQPGFPF